MALLFPKQIGTTEEVVTVCRRPINVCHSCAEASRHRVAYIFDKPQHPYTKALLDAVPDADPMVEPPKLTLKGEVATPIDPPPGCRLCNRCPIATDHCSQVMPELVETSKDHYVACHNL